MATATVERISRNQGGKRKASGGDQDSRDELHEPLVSVTLSVPEEEHSAGLLPGPEEGDPLQHQQSASLFSGGVNLSKTMLGVGVLALPKVTALLGVGTSLIVLAVVALLTYLSLHAVTLASERSGFSRYSDVVAELVGGAGQVLIDLALIINCFGILVIALIVVGDVLVGENGASGLLSDVCGDRQTVMAVICVVCIAPLVSFNRMRSVAWTSLLGVVAVVGWAVLTLLLFIVAWTDGELQTMRWWPHGQFVGHGFKSATLFLGTLPVVLVAFISQISLLDTLQDLKYARDIQVDKTTSIALAICAGAYAVLGICAYGIFGQGVKADVLNNFTVDALVHLVGTSFAPAIFMTVRIAFLVSLLGVFPLQMAPLRDAIWQLFFGRQQLRGPGMWLVTYLLLGGVYEAAIWVKCIWEPLVVIGSTSGVALALIFPGVLAMKTPDLLTEAHSAATWRKLIGAALVLIGTVLGVFGIFRMMVYRDPFGREI